jgi:hypothetical protein
MTECGSRRTVNLGALVFGMDPRDDIDPYARGSPELLIRLQCNKEEGHKGGHGHSVSTQRSDGSSGVAIDLGWFGPAETD